MTTVSDSTQEMVTEVYLTTDVFQITANSVRIFALDSHTIGLSNSPPNLWLEKRLWESEATVLKEDTELTIILPQEIIQFYRPKKIEIGSSLTKDEILLVISS